MELIPKHELSGSSPADELRHFAHRQDVAEAIRNVREQDPKRSMLVVASLFRRLLVVLNK